MACDAPGGDRYTRAEPRLIVEVLSPTTERIDRAEKLHAYKRVESLREYVLVAQDTMLVETHRRDAGGEWPHEFFTEPEDQLTFASVDLTLSLGDVYRNVRFEEARQDDIIPQVFAAQV